MCTFSYAMPQQVFLNFFKENLKFIRLDLGLFCHKIRENEGRIFTYFSTLSLLTLSKNCLDTVSLFNSFGKLQNVNVWILSCSLRHTVIMYASLKKEVNHLSSTLRALWGPYIYFVCESYLLER